MEMVLTFNDITFSPVTHQNSLWIRAVELARALGYKRPDILTKLYNKNADEFTPEMTQVIEIVENTDSVFSGNLQNKARIFSLRGCHLLAMFARTPVAKAFRKWVLDVLDQLAAEEQTVLPKVPHIQLTPSTPASRKPLRSLVHAWAQVSGTPHTALWPQVKAHFQLERIDDLPEEWIPDAIAWVQEKIDRCKENSARALPAPELSDLDIPNVVDHVTYEHGKRWFKELAELQRQLGGLKQEISIFARPGIRNACLTPEMQTLYDNMNDCVNMAVCALNLVQYGLRATSRIGAYTSFNK